MNRANFGNVITNGMQILSVGAATASRTLGRADKTLSNLSKEEQDKLYKMKADKLRTEMSEYETGGSSAMQHLSPEEKTAYRQKQAENIRKFTNDKEGEDSIDDIMQGMELKNNSPQVEELNIHSRRIAEWNDLYKQMNSTQEPLTGTLEEYLKGE